MRFSETGLPGVIVIEPDVFRDPRGYFLETFHAAKYAAAGIPAGFVQDNHSASVRRTLRGLHMQVHKPQGKLLRVVEGVIWDVAVDVRRGSPTFGRWTAETLSADNFKQLYVPTGFAHGFCVLSETAQVHYKCTELYDPADELGIAWNDPTLAIAWPVSEPMLSNKDHANPTLAAVTDRLPKYEERLFTPAVSVRGPHNDSAGNEPRMRVPWDSAETQLVGSPDFRADQRPGVDAALMVIPDAAPVLTGTDTKVQARASDRRL